MVAGVSNANIVPEFITGYTKSQPKLHQTDSDPGVPLSTTAKREASPPAQPNKDPSNQLADAVVLLQNKP